MPDKPITFDGRIFQKDPESSSPYRRNYACDDTGQSLHCAMWEFYNGPVPTGFHVHHKDGKKWHNEIGNFELLSASDHSKEHWARKCFIQRTCLQCQKKFKTRSTKGTGVKFCSNACKANHRRLARKDFVTIQCKGEGCSATIFRSRFKIGMGLCTACARRGGVAPKPQIDRSPRPCVECGEMFTPHKLSSRKTKFCSRRCKSADRRRRKADEIIEFCIKCGDPFSHSKFTTQKHCSGRCANFTKWSARKSQAGK